MNNISINVDEPPLLSDIDDYFDDEAFTSLEPGFGPQIGSPPDVIEPADRWKATFVTFYILGILTLLPWNFFVTANDYWMFKFRDLNVSISDVGKTHLQAAFTSYVSIAATGPSVLFLVINSIYGHRISIQKRVQFSMLLILLSFLLTAALVKVDTDKWQTLFFGITIGTVVIVNVCSALLQAALWSLASKFPSQFTSALISGQALGGIFSSGINILSLALGATSERSAFMYFVIANVTILVGLCSYTGITTKSIFYKYYSEVKESLKTFDYDPTDPRANFKSHFSFKECLEITKKVKFNAASAFLCFLVTISVFPALTVLIVPNGDHNLWNDKYFVPVVSFLIFNICDYAGRVFAGIIKRPLHHNYLLLVLSIVRLAFVPLFLISNLQPRYHLPVLIPEDVYFIIFICLFAFTNGYLINISMINVPSLVQAAEQEAASSIMAFFVGLGCAAGSLLSYGLLKLI